MTESSDWYDDLRAYLGYDVSTLQEQEGESALEQITSDCAQQAATPARNQTIDPRRLQYSEMHQSPDRSLRSYASSFAQPAANTNLSQQHLYVNASSSLSKDYQELFANGTRDTEEYKIPAQQSLGHEKAPNTEHIHSWGNHSIAQTAIHQQCGNDDSIIPGNECHDQIADLYDMSNFRDLPHVQQQSESEKWQDQTEFYPSVKDAEFAGSNMPLRAFDSTTLLAPHSPTMRNALQQACRSTGEPQHEHIPFSNKADLDFDLTSFDPNEWLLPQQNEPFQGSGLPNADQHPEYFFPPASTFEQQSSSPLPVAKSKRKRVHSTPSVSLTENPKCVDCDKRFRPATRIDRCNRCAAKYERATATPPTYTLSPAVGSVVAARKLIYPLVSRKGPREGDDVPSAEALAWTTDAYIAQLLGAVNTVVDGDDGEGWAARQQHVFNGKAKMESTYSNDHVTARIRALFHELLLFHTGSSFPPSSSSLSSAAENTTDHTRHFYSVGGDNAGYPLSQGQSFSTRFANICSVLRINKRVVMDVIEGRGVQGFVGNPWVYHRRKASNNDCNVKKKVIMERGRDGEEEEDEEEREEVEQGGQKKGKGKSMKGVDEDEGGGSGSREAGLSSMRARASKSRMAGKKERANDDNDGDDGDDMDWRSEDETPTYGSGRQRLLHSLYGEGRRRE